MQEIVRVGRQRWVVRVMASLASSSLLIKLLIAHPFSLVVDTTVGASGTDQKIKMRGHVLLHT